VRAFSLPPHSPPHTLQCWASSGAPCSASPPALGRPRARGPAGARALMPPPPLSPSILVAVLAPAYHAARVLQHPNPPPGEVRRWARYLLILALVSLAESLVLDRAFFWVPLYAELKTAALAWAAWVPGGADVAFETVVAPALAEHGPAVDAAAATARAAVAAAVAARAGDALRAARGAAGGAAAGLRGVTARAQAAAAR